MQKIKKIDSKNFSKGIALSIGVLVLSASLSYLILAWQEPESTPPGINVAAPLNVSSNYQQKTGALVIGGASGLDAGNSVLRVAQVPGNDVGLFVGDGNPHDSALIETNISSSATHMWFSEDNRGGGVWDKMVFAVLGNGEVKARAGIESYEGNIQSDSGFVKAPQLCIGEDCRNNWPANGSGSIIGGICPGNEVMRGITSDGVPICSGNGWNPPPGPCVNPLPNYTTEIPQKRMFVSDSSYNGFDVTSEAAAHAKCQEAAENAGMADENTHQPQFKALVYYGNANPIANNVIKSSTYYYTGEATEGNTICDWHLVAKGKSDFLTAGDEEETSNEFIKWAIKYNEYGNEKNVNVLTNFQPTTNNNYALLLPSNYAGWCPNTYCGCTAPTWQGSCVSAWSTKCTYNINYAWYGYAASKTLTWAYNQYILDTAVSTGPPNSTDICPNSTNSTICRNVSRSFYCVEQ